MNNNDLMPETAPSTYNENIRSSAEDYSTEQIIEDKDDCACISVSSTKNNEQIPHYRKQKRQHFNVF